MGSRYPHVACVPGAHPIHPALVVSGTPLRTPASQPSARTRTRNHKRMNGDMKSGAPSQVPRHHVREHEGELVHRVFEL